MGTLNLTTKYDILRIKAKPRLQRKSLGAAFALGEGLAFGAGAALGVGLALAAGSAAGCPL